MQLVSDRYSGYSEHLPTRWEEGEYRGPLPPQMRLLGPIQMITRPLDSRNHWRSRPRDTHKRRSGYVIQRWMAFLFDACGCLGTRLAQCDIVAARLSRPDRHVVEWQGRRAWCQQPSRPFGVQSLHRAETVVFLAGDDGREAAGFERCFVHLSVLDMA